ncbi:MAG TPA: 1-acyl-sn-glycerol-3-phosphate acyltransferase [bacterium]
MARLAMPPSLFNVRQTVRPVRLTWRWFCYLVVRAFYRRAEVRGMEYFPVTGSALVCANHPSALVDAIVVQAACPRIVHPLARSGLFKNPLMWPILKMIQAVPIFRRQDASDTTRNQDSFAQCYAMLKQGAALMIFPEGESHSDPGMRGFKTGAARLALGAQTVNGQAPVVVPVGLNYTDVGRFRSSVLVKFGRPLPIEVRAGETPEQAAVRITESIRTALERITLNPNSWAELETLRKLERFFALRNEKYRKRSLDQRFRALQKLLSTQQRLRMSDPERVERMRDQLDRFDRICRRVGIADYHLTVSYTPRIVTRFIVRSLVMLFLALPLGLWGAANSLLAFVLTKRLAVALSNDRYQYDTAKICLGMGFFSAFWAAQSYLVYRWTDLNTALIYAATLLPATMLALYMRRERERIYDNIRVFYLFSRENELREFLKERRRELEKEIRHLVFQAMETEHAA